MSPELITAMVRWLIHSNTRRRIWGFVTHEKRVNALLLAVGACLVGPQCI